MKREREEFEPIIAKGKKRELFKDKVIEFAEDFFYVISEKWKEILVGFLGIIILISLILGVLEYRKNKAREEFLTFESAYQSIVAYDMSKDTKFVDDAVAKLYQIQNNPKYISKIFLAWSLSKQGKDDEASKILDEIIYNDNLVLGMRKLASIFKINILAGKNCDEVIKIWRFIKEKERNLPPEEIDRAFTVVPIPIRTYFEVVRCSDRNPEVLQSLISEVDMMHTVERLVSQDRANMFVILKNYIYQRLQSVPAFESPVQQLEKSQEQ